MNCMMNMMNEMLEMTATGTALKLRIHRGKTMIATAIETAERAVVVHSMVI